eukprot:CAMPEP_0178377504 /NCGR_PEP_ID=MMETSP0689_2-20121128/3952_1 /TAXON_ID=160604 /ORGANISM="Amphidinium massartii, Strain CS-259" /LENGTH=383 /DNA_ID=CAMNT_0019997559 /DNA_START=338 /DNA_END=1486 /DNA_ORIENTATION=-
MVLHRPPSKDGMALARRRRKIIKTIARHSLMSFIVGQIWIALLAVLVHVVHGQEKVVGFLGHPTSSLARWSDSHPHSAAYIISVALTLASLVGVGLCGGLLVMFGSFLRQARDRIERELFGDPEGEEAANGDAAEAVEEHAVWCGGCEDMRLHCDRLCEDRPKCEIPCADTLQHVCRHACWWNDEHGQHDSMHHVLSTGSGQFDAGDVDHIDNFSSESAYAWALVCLVAVVAAIMICGAIFLCVIAAMWLQKVLVKSFQLQEIQKLVEEYEVLDLDAIVEQSDCDEAGYPAHMFRNGKTTEQATVNASLLQDLMYLYGYEVTPPEAMRRLGSFSASFLGFSRGSGSDVDFARRTQSFAGFPTLQSRRDGLSSTNSSFIAIGPS